MWSASEQLHVVASGRWIELSLNQYTPQWKYRVGPSVLGSQLADIQWKKRATPAGELELGYNDRHLTVLFEVFLHNSGISVEMPTGICGYTVEEEGVFHEVR